MIVGIDGGLRAIGGQKWWKMCNLATARNIADKKNQKQ